MEDPAGKDTVAGRVGSDAACAAVMNRVRPTPIGVGQAG